MAFYVQTWDEYYTQVLTLGVVSGPVEGVLTLCIVFAFTAYQGSANFWHRSMLETLGVPQFYPLPNRLHQMPFTEWYIAYGALVLCFATGSSIVHVMSIRRQRGQDPFEPLYGLLPFVVMWTIIPTYLYLRPIVLTNYLVPFTLFVSLLNAYSVGRMIVAHLVKCEFPYRNILMWPLIFGTVDAAGSSLGIWNGIIGDGVSQAAFVYLCLGLALGVYGSFVV